MMCDRCWVGGPGLDRTYQPMTSLDAVALPPAEDRVTDKVERCCFCWGATVAGILVKHKRGARWSPVCDRRSGCRPNAEPVPVGTAPL